MFEILTTFVSDITNFEVPIPLYLKIGIIAFITVSVVVGSYFAYELFDYGEMRQGYIWFIFIVILNLLTILGVFLYYNTKQNTYVGKKGKKGKRGGRGKQGRSVSCNYCKNNIYLQRVRKSDRVATLSTKTDAFKGVYDNVSYFDTIIENGNINYDSFVNGILLAKTVKTGEQESVGKFRDLMKTNSIVIYLVKLINESITKASESTYGTIRNPVGKVGYTPLADTAYGGLENFELNSFMANGNVMYPKRYNKLITFSSYNEKSGDVDNYTIWRPEGQLVNESPKPGADVQKTKYISLGDVCSFGDEPPKINDYVTISETCLDEINPLDSTLIFIYVGSLDFATESYDYTESNSFLIQNKIPSNIQMFSAWRTPMNTLLTNVSQSNDLINGTIATNMANDLDALFNEYGNVSTVAKGQMKKKLQAVEIPKILAAMVICRHYEIELRKELIYFINRYKTSIPEFSQFDTIKATLGDLMNKVDTTQKDYKKYNDNLMREASISQSGIKYDETKEKRLPSQITKLYESTNTKLLSVSVEIENSNNLFDLVNIVFDNGLETRIAVDSEGIAEGGIFLNELQETIIRLCKVMFPPNKPSYTIKDECLGTMVLDRERDGVIKQLTKVINEYYKLNDDISKDAKLYSSIIQSVNQYDNIMTLKIGQICGHIDNYMSKIADMDLDEITTSRLKTIIQIYEEANTFLTNTIGKA